ncbi:Fmu (Sun) domain protein [Emticicia oligotrophica DSM 17448]|uniref:Fmu (Sun) domain protein n=1 Tax=Emticicia oligotrophica (strain DSM 17448 / CIP 109782 / MTCC 6937 / GPTSA100-15) TaxID=929562 RepID=A0ABN4ALY0_EMTOG|nr:methyltransferase domain-containing protein [Emticicia oligotrophica]AFK03041.1 Fmu (Sun) domain protein [Emticicia oligotrophica DSM 17448]
MKYHRVLVEAVVFALQQIFNENRQADKVIEQVLKSNKKWGSRDRAFIAENTYEIVRWWRLLKFVANINCVRVEEEALFWQIFAAWRVLQGDKLPDWQDFKAVNAKEVITRNEEAQQLRKVRESVPDWIDTIGEEELGENWEAELHAMNTQAPVVLRTNTLKTNKLDLKASFSEIGIETETLPNVTDALVLPKRANVFSTELFKKGFFEVQDAGSQLIAEYLDVQAGMRVIDACAGAGGKTLHLATLMENKGRIIAMDVEDYKLQELQRRAKRNGIGNVETRLIEAKTIKRQRETADRLLLDVPCSGLGVLRRNPDAKWKLKKDFLEKIKQTQAEIITNYSKMLKKGGKMVYATCSILPSESEEQVKKFLAQNPDFNFISEKRTSPAKDGFDGFYMALIERK